MTMVFIEQMFPLGQVSSVRIHRPQLMFISH
jgi:hypothetical protein